MKVKKPQPLSSQFSQLVGGSRPIKKGTVHCDVTLARSLAVDKIGNRKPQNSHSTHENANLTIQIRWLRSSMVPE